MTEHQIQASFAQWVRLHERKYPELRLGFAIPNGGLRNKIVATKLKREGVRAGVPDWMLPAQRLTSNGLAIEFKVGRNRLTHAQREYRELLIEQSWQYFVCRSPDEAINAVEGYLESC
jgi:hypothetical protein